MFTGIVEGLGIVRGRSETPAGVRLLVDLCGVDRQGWNLGQSVALNGVCLTLAENSAELAPFDLAGETLRITSLGRLRVGDRVNVERALKLGGRLDGHLVQGHVDGVGEIRSFEAHGDDWWLEVGAGKELLAQILPRGSITVDGISLTAAEVGEDFFRCTIVPHTREVTNLIDRRPGDATNLEADVMGKWVRRMWETQGPPSLP